MPAVAVLPTGVVFPTEVSFPTSLLTPSTGVLPAGDVFPGLGASGSDGTPIVLNGMPLNTIDEFGVAWSTVAPMDGWDGSPQSSMQVTQKTRGAGGWTGPRNLTPRSLGLTGYLNAPDAGAAEDAIDRLNAAATLNGSLLSVQRGTAARSCIVYRQGDVAVSEITPTVFQWQVNLVAVDPRKFATALTGTTGLPASTGGLTVPFTVPLTISSTITSGRVQLTNPGNATGPVVLRINGPITGPQITHVGSGLTLIFASSLILTAGQWLEVDMEAQTALANGQADAPRNQYVTSRGWFGFDPGVNEFDYTAISGSGALTVTAVPAWQ